MFFTLRIFFSQYYTALTESIYFCNTCSWSYGTWLISAY